MKSLNGNHVSAEELTPLIMSATDDEIEVILNAVISRHGQLHPCVDISHIPDEKRRQRVSQIDKIISILEIIKRSGM